MCSDQSTVAPHSNVLLLILFFSIKERSFKDIFLSYLTHFPTFIPRVIHMIFKETRKYVMTFATVIYEKIVFEAQIFRNTFDPKIILYNCF